jgi:hypothetical protein
MLEWTQYADAIAKDPNSILLFYGQTLCGLHYKAVYAIVVDANFYSYSAFIPLTFIIE